MMEIFNDASLELTILFGSIFLLFLGIVFGELLSRAKVVMFTLTLVLLGACIYICLNKINAKPIIVFNQLYISNPYINLFKLLMVVSTSIVFFISFGSTYLKSIFLKPELISLILMTLLGGCVMISANDLIPLYLGLELYSVSLYILINLGRSGKFSEIVLKYFALNVLFSAILLYGMTLLYGFLGTTNFSIIAQSYSSLPKVPLGALLGFGLMMVGLVFKLFGPPLNVYMADVYEHTSFPISMFLMTTVKIILVLLLLKLVMHDFYVLKRVGLFIIGFVSIIFLFVGSIGIINQISVKKLLAYSSIYNVGFILLGIMSDSANGTKAAVIHVMLYTLIMMGIFALIGIIKTDDYEEFDITIFKGLGKTSPYMAFSFSILFLSQVGIPPLAGFLGRFYILTSITHSKLYFILALAIISMIIFTFYCLKILQLMYFAESTKSRSKSRHYSAEFVLLASSSVALNLFLIFVPSVLNVVGNYLKGLVDI